MREVMYKSLCYKVEYCPGSWKMPERILFVQFIFCQYNSPLICNKNYYFSIVPLLCSMHWTGSGQWDACSIFLFIITWKPIVQCFIYSRLYSLLRHRILHLLIAFIITVIHPCTMVYLISFWLVFSTTPICSHILLLLHTKFWFLLGQKET